MTVFIECFHLENEILVNVIEKVSENVINYGVLIRFVGSPHVYQVPESNCFIDACAIWAPKLLFNI